MTLFNQLLALCLSFLLMFFMIRGINRWYIDTILPKRKRHKIKNKNFIEWFLYKNYLSILPKSRILHYFLNFVLFIISAIAIIICHLIHVTEIGRNILWAYFVVNSVWLICARINLLLLTRLD